MQYNIYKDSVITAPVHLDVPMQLFRKYHLFSLLLPVGHLLRFVKVCKYSLHYSVRYILCWFMLSELVMPQSGKIVGECSTRTLMKENLSTWAWVVN